MISFSAFLCLNLSFLVSVIVYAKRTDDDLALKIALPLVLLLLLIVFVCAILIKCRKVEKTDQKTEKAKDIGQEEMSNNHEDIKENSSYDKVE